FPHDHPTAPSMKARRACFQARPATKHRHTAPEETRSASLLEAGKDKCQSHCTLPRAREDTELYQCEGRQAGDLQISALRKRAAPDVGLAALSLRAKKRDAISSTPLFRQDSLRCYSFVTTARLR